MRIAPFVHFIATSKLKVVLPEPGAPSNRTSRAGELRALIVVGDFTYLMSSLSPRSVANEKVEMLPYTVNSHLTDALNSGHTQYNGQCMMYQLKLIYFMYLRNP